MAIGVFITDEDGVPTPFTASVDTTGLATSAAQALALTELEAINAAVSSATPAPVVGLLSTVAVTPTVEATPDYSTGDVIGGVMTFASILRADAATGYLTSVRIATKILNVVQIDALIFNANPSGSTVTENGAFAIAVADIPKLKGVVEIEAGDWIATGAASSVGYKECRVPLTGAAADDIYIVLVARGTINLDSTSDLVVEATVDQN